VENAHAAPYFPEMMAEQQDFSLGRSARRLRLDTLVKLRWLAVVGQAVAVGVVHYGLGFAMPVAACLILIIASIWLNIALRLAYPLSHRLSERAAILLLAYDVLQLAALLYLTGGLANPFSVLFLAPVLISATALPPSRTIALGVLVLFVSSMLAFHHMPLPWRADTPLMFPPLYVAGVWFSILLGVAFTAVYAWRVSEEADDLAHALAAAELVMAREQHLSQLDGLAAAAAHELGTPLATITLVAKEIANAAKPGSPLAEDIGLLRQEVDRCRAILSKITTLNEDESPLSTLTLRQLLEEIAGPQRPFGVAIAAQTEGDGPEPSTRRNPSVLYGIGNLVDNAVDFALTQVTLTGRWTANRVVIEVSDDGPGFPPDILMRAGEPYLTTRGARSRGGPRPDGREGLGLGLFIAKTLLERSGATVSFANLAGAQRGAHITVAWPRKIFEGKAMREAADLEEPELNPKISV
jgi:two-component system sensor histidine kinase RegB